MRLFTISFCLTFLLSAKVFAQVNVQDSLVLVDLYNSTNGHNWVQTWNLSNPVNTWYGVVLQNGRVFRLELDANNISGNLPLSLGNLTAAVSISLQSDELTGNIPLSFKNLNNLSFLYLDGNQLSGKIDSELLNLPNLSVLLLGGNKLSGEIPNTFKNKSKLAIIDFSHNRFRGKIPASISNLINLQSLYINNNELKGTVPSLGDLRNLSNFYLDNNYLTFNGMEEIASLFAFAKYAPQADIPLLLKDITLSCSAGGTLANDTFHWYKNGTLFKTIIGDSTLEINKAGKYSVSITNSIATKLILYGDTVNISTLPVSLISFTTQKQNNSSLLQWQTSNEINNNYFDIERSLNSKIFSSIGTKQGLHNDGINNYSFIDKAPLKGINYYRLKQVDKDGKYTYSGIASVEFLNDGSGFAVAPNPADNIINVIIPSSNSISEIIIYNIVGKKLLHEQIAANITSKQINISQISSSVYNVVLIQNGKREMMKLVKK